MSNYHSKEWIMNRLQEHYEEALKYFKPEQIVGLFYQGSGNYQLDTEMSDVDSKLIVIPSLDSIVMNKQPVSTTHIRVIPESERVSDIADKVEDEEHIDFKDIRLYMQTFRKQNLNFVEILFTDYKIVNPMYKDLWNELVENRERIATMNRYQAVKSMLGIAEEKYHALKHPYPRKMHILDKFGYDPKQLHHLIRVQHFIENYVKEDIAYEDCLIPSNHTFLVNVKKGCFTLEGAETVANQSIETCRDVAHRYLENCMNEQDKEMEDLLDKIQCAIVKKSLKYELLKEI